MYAQQTHSILKPSSMLQAPQESLKEKHQKKKNGEISQLYSNQHKTQEPKESRPIKQVRFEASAVDYKQQPLENKEVEEAVTSLKHTFLKLESIKRQAIISTREKVKNHEENLKVLTEEVSIASKRRQELLNEIQMLEEKVGKQKEEMDQRIHKLQETRVQIVKEKNSLQEQMALIAEREGKVKLQELELQDKVKQYMSNEEKFQQRQEKIRTKKRGLKRKAAEIEQKEKKANETKEHFESESKKMQQFAEQMASEMRVREEAIAKQEVLLVEKEKSLEIRCKKQKTREENYDKKKFEFLKMVEKFAEGIKE